jgi:hypothetical protein
VISLRGMALGFLFVVADRYAIALVSLEVHEFRLVDFLGGLGNSMGMAHPLPALGLCGGIEVDGRAYSWYAGSLFFESVMALSCLITPFSWTGQVRSIGPDLVYIFFLFGFFFFV